MDTSAAPVRPSFLPNVDYMKLVRIQGCFPGIAVAGRDPNEKRPSTVGQEGAIWPINRPSRGL